MPDIAPPGLAWFRSDSERIRLVVAVGVILLWTCLVRLPFAHIVDDDEAFFSVMATRWLHGELPYSASFDVKPPLLYAIFAAAQAIFGASLATLKGLELVFTAASTVLLYRMVQRHGSQAAALMCAFLFPVYSLTLSGVNAINVVLQLPFLIAAFAAWLEAAHGRRPGGWILASGLMIGLAGMIKQTAIFEAVALAGLLLWTFRTQQPLKHLLLFGAGAAVPALIFASYFALNGHFDEAFDAVVIQAMTRVNLDLPENVDKPYMGLVRFLPLIRPLILIAGCAVMALVRRRQIERSFSPLLLITAGIWALSSALGVIALHAMFPYYAAPLIAPLLVLASALILHGIDFPAAHRRAAIALAVACLTLVPLWLERDSLDVSDRHGQDDFLAETATATRLKQLGLKAGEHILVLKRGLYVYVLTGTTPQSRYYHSLHLLCPFPTSGPDPLTEALTERPRFVVLADPAVSPRCETKAAADEITQALAAGYDLKDKVRGEWDRLYIYQRRP